MSKAKVQTQFGASTEAYADSDIHARGESLALLVDMIHPRPDWLVLDVATGAGHTALTFASHTAQVIATDLTAGMLTKTAELAAVRRLTNLRAWQADAEALPFAANSFDLVTCRLAFHHFPQPDRALAEFGRVLKPGGLLGFTDNITTPDEVAAYYYNAYEKLRDPSHHWVYPLEQMQAMMSQAGLRIEAIHRLSKEFEFHRWADRQHVTPEDKGRLLAMMDHIPDALRPLFAPHRADNTMYFSLWEAVIVAVWPGN